MLRSLIGYRWLLGWISTSTSLVLGLASTGLAQVAPVGGMPRVVEAEKIQLANSDNLTPPPHEQGKGELETPPSPPLSFSLKKGEDKGRSLLFAGGVAEGSKLSVNSPTVLENPQPVSTQAADLRLEAIAPSTEQKLDEPQLAVMPELLPLVEAAPSSPTASSSTAALPELNAGQAKGFAQTPTSPDSPAIPDPSTPDRTAQTSANTYDPNAGIRIPPAFGEGNPIERVYIHLSNPTGDPAQDEVLQQQLTNAFGISAGASFSPLFADRGVSQVRQLPFVQSAEYRLYESDIPGSVIVALLVKIQPKDTTAPPTTQPARGIVVSGDFRDFPKLYESDRTLVKFILNGGVAAFSDTHAWFSSEKNFIAGNYQPSGTITWPEFYLEPGLAAITRLGDTPIYLYGAASYTISGSLAPDIFRSDTRTYGNIEQLYGGLLVAERGSRFALNLSGGRQKFQLNQGFLFSQFSGSANALERAASFSNPRTAYETTILADVRLGEFRLRGFFVQPDELPIADSETQYLGASLSYNNNRNLEATLSYITVPQSSRLYSLPNGQTSTREGLHVINPRLRLSSLLGVKGLWAESEYAYEFSDRFAMSAHGGYIWLGYTAQDVSWRPSISYRFAGFSGDDPHTSTYERFDPLQAGGLSDWLQGVNLGKVYNNSNGFSHRVTVSVQPSDTFSLSLDYYYRFADRLNNLGGNRALQTLKSRDIGHEVLLTARYFLSQNFLLQGVSSIAFPGAAIRRAVSDPTEPWFTFQFSLFMFF
ncbi:MAG: alginate export family protein [Actinomycetota bacterium]